MRRSLPQRRATYTLCFEHSTGASTHGYVAAVSRFPNGGIGELFLNSNGKVGSSLDIMAADAAIAVSLALQHGCSINTLRNAMKRNSDGSAMGPLGHALDLCADEFGK